MIRYLLVPFAIHAAACTGGSVARYAPCTSTDSCPSSTVCEAATTSSSAGAQTFCTYSCNEQNVCPNDPTGTPGVCVSELSTTTDYGFCFQDCTSQACPSGEACTAVQGFEEPPAMVCVPAVSSPLSATTWQSGTITSEAMSNGVATSSYAVTFGPATYNSGGAVATGAFTATLTQTYASSLMYPYAECTETTTFSGGQWTAVTLLNESNEGSLSVTNVTTSTTRTGCRVGSSDVTDEPDDYILVNDGSGASYAISGDTMMVDGGQSGTPYPDSSTWTFTKM
jgi:hypothetical protein